MTSSLASRIPFLRSGLVLSKANVAAGEEAPDAHLTAEDFLSLRLGGLELLVLSACETGLGDAVLGQGVLGLRTALSASGARGLLMSLWKVPDEESQILMREFYAGIWESKLPPAAALLRAQLKLRDSLLGDAKTPRKWAGWILVGE